MNTKHFRTAALLLVLLLSSSWIEVKASPIDPPATNTGGIVYVSQQTNDEGRIVSYIKVDSTGQKVIERVELGVDPRSLEEVRRQNTLASVSSGPTIIPLYTYETGGTFQGGVHVANTAEDINGDKRPEILASGLANGPLFAWNLDGEELWYSTNLLEGANYVAAYQGTIVTGIMDSYLTNTLRILDSQGSLTSYREAGNYISDSANLVDLDGNGTMEICIGEQDFKLHCYTSSLVPLWTSDYFHGQRVETGSISDIDGDGTVELVVGENGSSGGQFMRAYELNGQLDWQILINGETNGYPGLWPTSGDFNGDGNQEIAYFSRITEYPWTPKVRIIDASTGVLQWQGTPINGSSYGNVVAVGDLNCEDGQNIPELATLTEGGIDIFSWNGTTYSEFPGWPQNWDDGYTWSGDWSVTMGDVNNDGFQEIVAGSQDAGSALHGEVRVYSRFGELLYQSPMDLGGGGTPAVVFDPIRGRNVLVLKGTPWDGYSGWKVTGWIMDFGGNIPNPNSEWGQFGRNAQHTSYWQPSECHVPACVAPTSVSLAASDPIIAGQSMTFTILVLPTDFSYTTDNEYSIAMGDGYVFGGRLSYSNPFDYSPNHTYSAAGVYTATATVTATCGIVSGSMIVDVHQQIFLPLVLR